MKKNFLFFILIILSLLLLFLVSMQARQSLALRQEQSKQTALQESLQAELQESMSQEAYIPSYEVEVDMATESPAFLLLEAEQWQELLSLNSDTVAWLQVPDTPIDYPLMQTENNADYLNHNFYREASAYGSLFLDYESDLSSGRNLVVYGHNMKDRLMFGSLGSFREASYGAEHTFFYLQPAADETWEFELMSVFVTSAYPRDGTPDYRQVEFTTEEAFAEWLAYFAERSLYALDLDLSEARQVLTFSTCAYDFGQARLVVMAVR